MAITELVTDLVSPTALTTLGSGAVVIAEGRSVTQIDPATDARRVERLSEVAWGLCTLPDGSTVMAAVPRLGLVRIEADLAGVTTVAGVIGARDVCVEPLSGDLLVVVNRSPGRLLRMASDGTNVRLVTMGLVRPMAVAASADGSQAFVIEAGLPRRLVAVDLATGQRRTITAAAAIAGARDVAPVATGGADQRLLLVTAGGRVLTVDPATSALSVIASGASPMWSAATGPTPETALVGAGTSVAAVDVPAPDPVEIHGPDHPLYLSSWAEIPVTVRAPLSADDIVLLVDPPQGGLVSNSRDTTFDPARPTWLLSVGNLVGDYRLSAVHAMTGDPLAEARFSITDRWTEADGPPISYIGKLANTPPDPAWGGGDPFVPQNIDVHPAVGIRNIGVVIVETSDLPALDAAGQQALRTMAQNEVFDGVSRNGVMESAAGYWADVSNGQLTLANAGVVGPIRLAGTWADYVAASLIDDKGKGGSVSEFGAPAIAAIRAANEANAAQGLPPLLDLMTVDAIVLVVRSLPAMAATPTTPEFPGRFTWPASTRPGGFQLDFEVGRTVIVVPFPFGPIELSLPVSRRIQMFTMPHDWSSLPRTVREFGETVAHELGHTLGLLDAYARNEHAADIKARDVASDTEDGKSWSLMSWEGEFPLLTVSDKMRLGFVRPEHVRNLSFATLGPVDEEVTLHASDLGAPPNGRFSAVEVRINDGRNYYFEYRRETPTERSDQDLPATRTVFATDVVSGDTEPKDRRVVLRLRDDSDADKAEFQTGDDYEETDTSSPKYPNDFRMEVVQTDAEWARIRLTYGDAKPDPQIRPWAQSTNWKSPDLRVENARNLADQRFRDIPWEGHDNRIIATVRNPGKVDAKGVRVDFFVKDFTLGGGAETAVGSQVLDVPTGTDVEFRSGPWVPPALSLLPPFVQIRPHYCVVARIAEYVDPNNPAVREITLDNNEAQSNHTQLISVSASPSSREIATVRVDNPLDRPAVCQVQVRQSSPLARSYLDHSWVFLQPGEQRDVRILTESMVGDPLLATHTREFGAQFAYELPNSVRLTGIVDDRTACHGLVTGGAHIQVRAARATEFVTFEREGGLVFGRIEAIDNREGADGVVLVTIARPGDDPERELVRTGEAHDGDFRVEVGDVEPGWQIQGHYLGRFDLAPCESKVVGTD